MTPERITEIQEGLKRWRHEDENGPLVRELLDGIVAEKAKVQNLTGQVNEAAQDRDTATGKAGEYREAFKEMERRRDEAVETLTRHRRLCADVEEELRRKAVMGGPEETAALARWEERHEKFIGLKP